MSSLLVIIVIIAIAVIALARKSPEGRGKEGELSVAIIAASEVRKGLYGHVLQNVYVPRSDGSTSEIDVLLVSTKGIFVFESKNYAGYIFGNDQQRNWTVTLYTGKDWLGRKQTEKHSFYNPVWQNKTHMKAVRRFVNASVPIYSVVVFSNRGELKNVTYDSNAVTILQMTQLKSYLANIRNTYPDVLTQSEVDSIANDLSQYTGADEEKKRKHLEDIQRKNTERLSATDVCPLCGGHLVVRTARRGPGAGQQFYGCSNYPKCKYTRNID